MAILARRGRSDLCAVLRITYVLGAGEVRMAAIDVSPPSRRASIALAFAPLPILATFVAIKFGLPNLYHHIIQEDQVLENLQFLLYVAASATGFLAAREFRLAGMRGPAIAWYLFWAVALLVALEEVSWFERAVGVHLDWLQSRNVQNETNIHNLSGVQPHLHVFYAVVGGIGAIGWIMFRDTGVLPPKELCLYFLPTFLLYAFFLANPLAVGHTIVWRDQEPIETLLALGFFLNACLALLALKSQQKRRPSKRTP